MRLEKIGICVLITGFVLAPPIDASVLIENSNFAISLPNGWMEIPQEVLQAAPSVMKDKNPNFDIPIYDYGFQLQSSQNWMEFPYVLVEVKNSGRISEFQLKKMLKDNWTNYDGVKKQAKALEEIMSGVAFDGKQYDEASHTLWATLRAEFSGYGNMQAIGVIILTESGYIQFYAYSWEAHFQHYLPIFRQMLSSIVLPPHLAYKPRWNDNIPLLNKINTNELIGHTIRTMAGITILGLLSALYRIVRRKIMIGKLPKQTE